MEKIYFSTWIAKGKTENIVFNYNIQATSALAAGFHAGLSQSNWNWEMLLFVEGRKLESPEKKTLRARTTNKLNPHDTVLESNPCYIGGKATIAAPV